MLTDILFVILFTLLMTWSVSLQIVLQNVSEQKARAGVIFVIILATLISGFIAVII